MTADKRPGFTPHFSWGSMASLDKDTLAYLTVREGTDNDGDYWEVGVIGHGPAATALTDQVAEAVREWDKHGGNGAPKPTFRMATGAARATLTDGNARFIIDKLASRITVDWM